MVCCDRFFILLSHNPAPRITFQNRTISQKALSLLPYERSVGFASLRNSGRSTSGIHARPLSNVRCCRPKKFGRLPEGLSFHQPLQNRTIPCFAPSHFPPLSKVRCCRPKKFGRLPEGLLPIRTNPPKTLPSLENRHHHCLLMNALLFHIRTIPLAFRTAIVYMH